MSNAWQAYARHILDVIEKIERIQQRGDLTKDEVLYDASYVICKRCLKLRNNCQTHSNRIIRPFPGNR